MREKPSIQFMFIFKYIEISLHLKYLVLDKQEKYRTTCNMATMAPWPFVQWKYTKPSHDLVTTIWAKAFIYSRCMSPFVRFATNRDNLYTGGIDSIL